MSARFWVLLMLAGLASLGHAGSSYPPKDMPSGTYASPNVIMPAQSSANDNGCGGQSEDVQEEDANDDSKNNDKSKSASSAKVVSRNKTQPRLKVMARDCVRPRP